MAFNYKNQNSRPRLQQPKAERPQSPRPMVAPDPNRSPNSFYNYGTISILSIEQDETSGLWKIKFATPDHYVVSREFDRSVGILANADDGVVRNALMDFSDSVGGNEFSIYKTMDLFVDRCFSDDAFYGQKPEYAVWLSGNWPTYAMVEEALNGYGYRMLWFADGSDEKRVLDTAVFRTYSSEREGGNLEALADTMKRYGANAVFVDSDDKVGMRNARHRSFVDMPLFVTEYKANGTFNTFRYTNR